MRVDTVHDELWVANNSISVDGSVEVFARFANGNATPLRRIVGPATGLSVPEDVALDLVHDEALVANEGGSVTVYSRIANGNASPVRILFGASTQLGIPQGIDVAPALFADGFELGNTTRWSTVSP